MANSRKSDDVVSVIEGDRLIPARVERRSGDDPFRTFGEWDQRPTAKPMPNLQGIERTRPTEHSMVHSQRTGEVTAGPFRVLWKT